jgi:Ni2+-binding GTPase involved in maturation of urease and hydrogenase
MPALLHKFIASFQKAIRVEMDAMRQRMGPFEVPLADGKHVESRQDEKWRFVRFRIAKPNEKLALQAEYTLRSEKSETLVTITELSKNEVVLRIDREIDLRSRPFTLIIYPWFLYERLQQALENLEQSEDLFVTHALMLFGKHPPHKQSFPLELEHQDLNASQQQAIQLCSDSNLAFVWGPPGTGKTTTLAHIVTELLAQGHRILITSTTNAAVDQALAKLADLEEARMYFEQGQILRIGQSVAETCGASLPEVMRRVNTATRSRLDALKVRIREAQHAIDQCGRILEQLEARHRNQQTDLFRTTTASTVVLRDLRPVFGENWSARILPLPPEEQEAIVMRRQKRLFRLLELCRIAMKACQEELRRKASAVVQKSHVILSTMTNVYMSALLQDERFDVVIVEEAGMAILPTIFYCAALARKKVIIVGDPQQLPPIVQSDADYVYRAMGRNIFDVATANSEQAHETIIMLDTQYRMHPVIGDLVSALFYDGKLRNGENTPERAAIAANAPYPGNPLIMLDTHGQTSCATHEGSYSRFNEPTARKCVELAVEAVQAGIESVAIITPYVAQSRLIRQLLSEHPETFDCVECQTIRRFQGSERDMVILDTVDTAPLSPGKLLADQSSRSASKNLINVSISRAKGKLVIMSDVAYFREKSPKSMLNYVLQQASLVGVRVSWS